MSTDYFTKSFADNLVQLGVFEWKMTCVFLSKKHVFIFFKDMICG